jgi:hypothetical protein
MPMDRVLKCEVQLQDQSEEDYRELPCRDFDLDCYGFDGVIPFGNYARCQAYMPDQGRCIFIERFRDPA